MRAYQATTNKAMAYSRTLLQSKKRAGSILQGNLKTRVLTASASVISTSPSYKQAGHSGQHLCKCATYVSAATLLINRFVIMASIEPMFGAERSGE